MELSEYRRAAQYIRMSTDMQKYSTENQLAAIADYALERQIKIVRTYSDAGRSGLGIKGRAGLQELLSDVKQGVADFSAILVYDISRWGRFQDTDESAYYEFICREAGIEVRYCAEQFENDGSLTATVLKSIKRAMAAEYSRELSTKVFIGKCTLVKKGFRHGGLPGFGLRRMLIDERGNPKFELSQGQQKSIHTDRVILVPGPSSEIETVRNIFWRFVNERQSLARIAADLNDKTVKNSCDRPWRAQGIRDLLANEKYIGNNVFNRTSARLKGRCVRNPHDLWIRVVGAFEPIVDHRLFAAAQARLRTIKSGYTDQQLLDYLTALWCRHGHLSSKLMSKSSTCPSMTTFASHFGSMFNAYQRLGYRHLRLSSACASVRGTVSKNLAEALARQGHKVRRDRRCGASHFWVDNELRIGVVVRCSISTREGVPRWVLHFNKPADLSVVVRLTPEGTIHDYLVLPRMALPTLRLTTAPYSHVQLDAFRSESLDFLVETIKRVPIQAPKFVLNTGPSANTNTPAAGAPGDMWPLQQKRRPPTTASMLSTCRRELDCMALVVVKSSAARQRVRDTAGILRRLFQNAAFLQLLTDEKLGDMPSILSAAIHDVP